MKGFAFTIRFFGVAAVLGLSSVLAAIPNTITFKNAFVNGTTGVTFARPVFFAQVPGKDSTYVVLEQQRGNAIIVHRSNGSWVKDTLLKQTVVANQNEMGFLSLAFHPDFTTNRKYYVFYSKVFNPTTSGSGDCWTGSNVSSNANCGLNVVEERQADPSLIKDAGVAPRLLLSITKSAMNHNGGDIAFGKSDGFLYVGIGDGGDLQGDTAGRGQNPDTLLGKFLRIDVDHPASGKQYGLPADNPFVNTPPYRPEIYALGVRNPWRWSFDALTGMIWAGEVGNGNWEEVDTIAKGGNYGWAKMEGFNCQNISKYSNCSKIGLGLPIAAYPHTGGGDTIGTAVVGGYVYRGNPASPYYGLYFYGDNGTSQVWVARVINSRIIERITLHPSPTTTGTAKSGVSAFGQDFMGNLYALGSGTSNTGTVDLLSSPDLVSTGLPPPTSISPHRSGKAFAPASLKDLSGVELHNLQGRKVPSASAHNGVYVTKRPGDDAPALVPVLK